MSMAKLTGDTGTMQTQSNLLTEQLAIDMPKVFAMVVH